MPGPRSIATTKTATFPRRRRLTPVDFAPLRTSVAAKAYRFPPASSYAGHVPKFDLSYDYRCPFAKNIHLHVITALRAGADFDVNFAPWSLSQGGRPEGAPDVWNDPAYDADLLSLAAAVSV